MIHERQFEQLLVFMPVTEKLNALTNILSS